EELSRRLIDLAERQDESFQLRHVERRGGAFAGHVGDEHAEPIITKRKEVVVVAAHLARRNAERRDADARKVQRPSWQQRHLDLPRDAKLFFETLLLGCGLQQVLDAAGHLIERIRELAELV